MTATPPRISTATSRWPALLIAATLAIAGLAWIGVWDLIAHTSARGREIRTVAAILLAIAASSFLYSLLYRRDRALRRLRGSLDQTLDQLSCIVWSTDSSLRVTHSRGSLFAGDPVSLPARGTPIHDWLRNFDADFLIAAHRDVLDGADRRNAELDWHDRVLRFQITPLRSDEGQIEGVVGACVDVTDTIRNQREANGVRARLEAVVASSLDAIITMNSAGRVIDWNREAEELFGWTAAEASGQPVEQLVIPPGFRGAHAAGLHRYLTTGEAKLLNRRVRVTAQRRSGDSFPAELSITPIALGEETFFAASIRDLTESLRLENDLVEREQLWRGILEQSLVAIYTIREGHIEYANQRTMEMTGYSLDELRTMNALDVVHEDDRLHVQKQMDARLRGNSSAVQYRARWLRKTGEVIVVEVFGSKLVSAAPGAASLIATALDVTEVVHAERAVRESELWFRSLIENAIDMIGVLDDQGRYTYVSPSLTRVLGYQREEIIGTSPFDIIHPEDAPSAAAALEQIFREPDLRQLRLRVRARDGSWKICDIAARRESTPDGRTMVIINATDVTAAVQREKRLASSERLGALGRVAASMAHEFNNVLMGIQPFAEVIGRTSDPEMVTRAVTQIGRAVRRGRSITGQVLEFTRATAPHLERVAVEQVLSEASDQLRPLLHEKWPLRQVIEDPPPVLADRQQLQQIVINLCLNARDAMPEGGDIVVTARAARGDDHAPGLLEDHRGLTHIAVSDSGSGMSPDTLRQIFEPFFTTRGNRGTGLGLAICHQMVTAHEGHIYAESKEGEGTTMHVLLPSATEPARVSAAENGDSGSPSIRKALLIEDDDMVAAGLEQLLAIEGIEIDRAATGEEGIELLARLTPDIVLLDVSLPDMSGVDVYRWIEQHRPQLPSLFITGHADPEDLREALGAIPVPVVRKPFSLPQLAEAIAEALKRSEN